MARRGLCCPMLGAAGASLPDARRGGGFVAGCLARRWLRCPMLGAAVASLPDDVDRDCEVRRELAKCWRKSRTTLYKKGYVEKIV